MKKTYVKPAVYAESFELVEHIAGDCVVNDGFAGAHHRNASSCSYSDDNLTLFVNASGCQSYLFTNANVPLPDPTSASDIVAKIAAIGMDCYNSFLATGKLFAS